jgi:hypothetical protein
MKHHDGGVAAESNSIRMKSKTKAKIENKQQQTLRWREDDDERLAISESSSRSWLRNNQLAGAMAKCCMLAKARSSVRACAPSAISKAKTAVNR